VILQVLRLLGEAGTVERREMVMSDAYESVPLVFATVDYRHPLKATSLSAPTPACLIHAIDYCYNPKATSLSAPTPACLIHTIDYRYTPKATSLSAPTPACFIHAIDYCYTPRATRLPYAGGCRSAYTALLYH
jgi:hypothetical protein